MVNGAHLSEDKSQKAMIEAEILADNLSIEQELAQSITKEVKILEYQLKDIQTRLDEAETNALKVNYRDWQANLPIT